jgi:hypothetical protein
VPPVNRSLAFAALFLLSPPRVAAGDPASVLKMQIRCTVPDLPTALPEGAALVTIEDHQFVSAYESWSSFRLANRTGESIEAMTIVVEYLDAQGATLLEAVVADSRKGVDEPYPVKVSWYFRQRLSSAIEPGDSVRAWAFSDFTVPRCPAMAKVTLLALRLSDGTTRIASTRGWKLPPSVLDAPQYFMLPRDSPLPERIPVTIEIDAQGHPGQIQGLQGLRSALADQISAQTRLWTFGPALLDGMPVASVLPMLLRFHLRPKKGFCNVALGEVTSALVVADLIPGRRSTEEWRAYIGCRDASSIIPYAQ